MDKAATESTFQAVAEEMVCKLEREQRAPATISERAMAARPCLSGIWQSFRGRDHGARVAAVLREVEGQGLYETAKRLRSTCSMVFRFAIASGRADSVIHQVTCAAPLRHIV